MGLYNADGSINVTEVDGSTYTGLYAADGSWNVVLDTPDIFGMYHPCGALNATHAGNDSFYSENGFLNLDAPTIRSAYSSFSAIVGGQSLIEYMFIRGDPRVAVNLCEDIRTHFGFSDSGSFPALGYSTASIWHDGSAEAAEDWTVRIDNLAAGGSALLDIANSGSQIAGSNYWWNTQDNTATTSDPLDEADTPGPLLRALLARIATRVAAGYPFNAFIWSQGTTDQTTNETQLATYKDVLQNELIPRVRTANGTPNLKVFINHHGRVLSSDNEGPENIRQVQREVVAETPNVYFGAEEYPRRWGSGVTIAGTADGSNVVLIADTTSFPINSNVEVDEVDEGAFVTALVTDTSITLSKYDNNEIVDFGVTGPSVTLHRTGGHFYPGTTNTEPSNETDGFYAEAKELARRIADIFNVGGITASLGPYVSSISGNYGSNILRANLTHEAGTDIGQLGEADPWHILLDDVELDVHGVTKIDASTVDLTLGNVLLGTTASAQYAWGAMNNRHTGQFLFDNASPVPFPMQATEAVEVSLGTATAEAGTVAITEITPQADETDDTAFSFNVDIGSAAAGKMFYFGIASRAATGVTHQNVRVDGVRATKIADIPSATGNLNRLTVWAFDGSAGGTVAVTGATSATSVRRAIIPYTAVGQNTTTIVSDAVTSVASNDPKTPSVAANSGIIGMAMHHAGALRTLTWAGVAEDFDTAIEGGATSGYSGAHAHFATASTPTVNCTSSGSVSGISVIYLILNP